MSKRKSEENVIDLCENEIVNEPSTSTGITDVKRSRLDYNFWQKPESQIEPRVVCEENVKINQLKVGKILGKFLKIRITYISDIRKTKIGDILSFHGIDETGEISIITFGQNCESICNFIKINNLYSLVNFSVNNENVAYPSGSGNHLQVKLNSDAEIEELGDDENFQKIYFKFVPLLEVQLIDKGEKIDIVGVLVENFGLEKNWKGTSMRELALTDTTEGTVIITLWNVHAEKFSAENFTTLIVRNGIVTEFEGKKKINCLSGTLVWINPNIEEAEYVKKQFLEKLNKN